jgi:hypothetical protein
MDRIQWTISPEYAEIERSFQMQKWEYITANVGYLQDKDNNGKWVLYATSVNDIPFSQREGGFFFGKQVGKNPKLTEFLNDVGNEGWELISVITTTNATLLIDRQFFYTFKRQILVK